MKQFTLFLVAFAIVMPLMSVHAASFDTAIWIPYWRKTEGASSTEVHLKAVTQISPFAYELQADGSIKDSPKMSDDPWATLISDAKDKKIKIYPTILAYPHNATEQYNLYLLLAQREQRRAHEKAIVDIVVKNNYDGIDIDYENKTSDTKPYFSAFLTELAKMLHKKHKKLICTVEARTPPDSKFATTSLDVLSKVEYSNDYRAIGKACDQVRIMAYDQGSDDMSLVNHNKASGTVYKPVADIDWVKKVITLALEDIKPSKILLGVPTYGYKYEIVPPHGTTSQTYSRIGSMNWNYSNALIKSLNATSSRNNAGELSFIYSTSTGVDGQSLGGWKQYLVWYSDSIAIADKIRIAKLYRLQGVAVFKIDGGNDPDVWSVLQKNKK